jgi:hypothetical protein
LGRSTGYGDLSKHDHLATATTATTEASDTAGATAANNIRVDGRNASRNRPVTGSCATKGDRG